MTTAELSDVEAEGPAARPSCAEIYEAQFAFVWRNARRLGVAEQACEDVVQEVFVVVQRRLGEFEARSSIRTWLYGILNHVVQEQRRRDRQRLVKESIAASEGMLASANDGADQDIARKEATQIVDSILAEMSDEKRALFVLVDMEEVSVPDAACGLGINLNTAYARLRAARLHFSESVKRIHARRAHEESRSWWWRRR